MDILKFMFSNFWVFIGFIILIEAITSFIVNFIKAFIPDTHYHIDGTKVDIDEFIKWKEVKDDK